jgi:integrase
MRPRRIPQLKPYKSRRKAGVVVVGRVILGGVHHYCGPWGPDPLRPAAACVAEYDRRVAEWLAGVTAPVGSDLTVRQALAAYAEHARAHYRDDAGRCTGHYPRVKAAVLAAGRLYGGDRADQFGPKKLKAVRAHLLAQPHPRAPGRTLSRGYVNSLVACVQKGFTWLVSEELVPAAVGAALRAVVPLRRGKGGREPPPVLPPDPAAVAATLAELPPVVRAMVEVGRLTGMRPGEVCRMRPRDVSTDPARPVTLSTGQRVAALEVGGVLMWVYGPPAHKTAHAGKPRVAAIGPKAQAVLTPYLERDPDAYCFSPAESVALWRADQRRRRKSRVQPSQLARAVAAPRKVPQDKYTKDSFRQAVHRACDRAGVARWNVGQLRHAVADLVSERHDEDTAAAVLGNSVDVVRVYTLQRIGKAAAVMARVG